MQLSEESDEYEEYRLINLSELIYNKNSMENKFCTSYTNIKINAEIKDAKDKGFGWIFSIHNKNDKLDCIYWAKNIKIQNNKIYEVYGSLNLGRYGIQFKVHKMSLIESESSLSEKLLNECQKKKYLDQSTKKTIDIINVNNIIILSKDGTQGLSDFIEHLKIPLNISIKNISLEGTNTVTDIIKAIDNINISSKPCDLILICRGGGDTSILSKSFDKMELFDAIKKSKIPISCAIGHTNDKKQRLLINEICDKNFDTPTGAAEKINTIYKDLFVKLYYNILRIYEDIIRQFIISADSYFDGNINEKINKLQDKLDILKNDLIKKIIPGPIVDPELFLSNNINYVYIPEGNKYAKYKIEKEEYMNIKPSNIELISKIEKLEDLDKIVKKFNTQLDLDIINNLRLQLESISKLEKHVKQYEDIKDTKSKYYLRKIPKFTLNNVFDIKSQLLLYQNSIKSIKPSNELFDNNKLNELKYFNTDLIDETIDVIKILSNIQNITENNSDFSEDSESI